MSRRDVLHGASHRRVVRDGDTVRRPTFPWSPAVHALLRHLEDVDFPHSPRVVEVDGDHEVLTYIDGEAGSDGWKRVVGERGLSSAARMLRDYHQAVDGWSPEPGLIWSNGASGPCPPGELICHGDFGPWNIVWRGSRPIGMIDFDYAYPSSPRSDVVYALEYVVPFRSDEECVESLHYRRPPDRRRRLEIFVEAYGLASVDGLVQEAAETHRATLDTVRELAGLGAEPQATWVSNGYLDVLQQRIGWIEDLAGELA